MRIGLAYVRGSLPAFEDFGYLPTDIVNQNGLVNGSKAHRVLDGIIIPGGSIIESGSFSGGLGKEIKKMASQGKFVLGICSGFQVLAEKTDIGRRSPCPVFRDGLGLLNVSFHPMISNDRVEAAITGQSFLTAGLKGEKITGFHCHTYGEIRGDAPEIMRSIITRADYRDTEKEVLSGVCSDDGNIAGTMVHGCLDENPELVENILKFLDAGEDERAYILEANKKLRSKIKAEVGIDTGIKTARSARAEKEGPPPAIMVASTGSDSGKTFIVTGLAGALRRRGLRVGVIKVGPDVRDIVPSLYLVKEKMEQHSSIQIGHLGWMELPDVIESLKKTDYDLVLIEGVMSILTGLLNERVPYSGAEIALAGDIPVVLVSGCSKGGIESAAVDLRAHMDVLRSMGIDVTAGILNKVYDWEILERTSSEFMALPRIRMSERGGKPEVEIKLEEFCLRAMETVEENLDVDEIISAARKPVFRGYMPFDDVVERFNNIK